MENFFQAVELVVLAAVAGWLCVAALKRAKAAPVPVTPEGEAPARPVRSAIRPLNYGPGPVSISGRMERYIHDNFYRDVMLHEIQANLPDYDPERSRYLLSYLVKRGSIIRISRGVYRANPYYRQKKRCKGELRAAIRAYFEAHPEQSVSGQKIMAELGDEKRLIAIHQELSQMAKRGEIVRVVHGIYRRAAQ